MADAKDLKSFVPLGTCGFESRSGYSGNACVSTACETYTKTLDVRRVRRFFAFARHSLGRSVHIGRKSLSSNPSESERHKRMAKENRAGAGRTARDDLLQAVLRDADARQRDATTETADGKQNVVRRRVHPLLGVAHSARGVRQISLLWRLQLSAARGVSQPLPHTARQPAESCPTALARNACQQVRGRGTVHALLPAVSDSDAVCLPKCACQLAIGRQRSPPPRVERPAAPCHHLEISRRGPLASGRITHDRLPPHRHVASSRERRQTSACRSIWSHVPQSALFRCQSARRRPPSPRCTRSSPVALNLPRLLNWPRGSPAAIESPEADPREAAQFNARSIRLSTAE